MKHLKRFDEQSNQIEDIVNFINPSDPMMSNEYYYYIWGDDEAYYDSDKLTVQDYLNVIESTVFKLGSNTSKKFGFDFIDSNKDNILLKCKEDLISNGIRE